MTILAQIIAQVHHYLNTTPDFFYTVTGGVGAVLVLLGFYRTSIGRWTNKSLWYELDNIVGASCLIVYALHNQTYISIVINAVWLLVAFRGLIPFAERYGARIRRKARSQGLLLWRRRS
jgi:hypothetical protein